MFADGRVPICKCIFKACYDETTEDINIDELQRVLRQIDKPWLPEIYQSAIKRV